VDNATLARGRQQIKVGVDFVYVNLPDRKTNVPVFPGGLSFFFPINFSALTGIPGLPNFTALQAFDPTLRSSDQRAFLIFLSAALPIATPGFPKGLNLANLSLPLAYIQGFGDTRLNGSVKQFSTFFQDDIR